MKAFLLVATSVTVIMGLVEFAYGAIAPRPEYLASEAPPERRARMKTKTTIRADTLASNHNETLVKAPPQGLKVKTGVKAGGENLNHNETLVKAPPQGLKVKTKVRAGGTSFNYNESLVADR
jgi:hypothetical protein